MVIISCLVLSGLIAIKEIWISSDGRNTWNRARLEPRVQKDWGYKPYNIGRDYMRNRIVGMHTEILAYVASVVLSGFAGVNSTSLSPDP